MKTYFLLFSIILLSACTSLVEKGDKLFVSGDFQSAADFYERALVKDQNNVEAQIGLRKARNKIIDRGLIEVRMLRLSNNMSGAAEKLETILRNQDSWNLSLSGAIASTQSEESRYARSWLKKQAKLLADGQFPDSFRWLEYSYRYLIQSAQLGSEFSLLSDTVSRKGANKCKSLARDVHGQRFFLKAFTEQYCANWQQSVSLSTASSDTLRYRSLSVDNDIYHSLGQARGKGSLINSRLRGINESFRNSIWYAENSSRNLRLNATGRTRYTRDSYGLEKTAHYTTEIKRKVKNNKGQEVIEVREVNNSHKYNVTSYHEVFSMDITVTTHLDGVPITRIANYDKDYYTESHSETFAPANIWPSSPNFLDLSSIVNTEMQMLNQKFLTAMNQRWQNKYCKNGLASNSGENILRCAAIEPNHSFVNSWFEKNFGVNYTDLQLLYGI